MEILSTLLFVFFLVAVFPIKRYQNLLGKPVDPSFTIPEHENEKPTVRRISRFVRKLSFLLPQKRRCLVQSVTIKLLLNRRKIDSLILFGVALTDHSLIAHAWIKYGQSTLIENRGNFIPLLTII